MSVRSAVAFRDNEIPVGEQNLQQVLTNGNDAGRLNILNLTELTTAIINGQPVGTQTLGQTLTNGNTASKDIDMSQFSLTNVSSINGFSTNRNNQGGFIAQQSISATLNTDFTIALATPISLDIGTYLANIKVNISDVTATTEYYIYLYLNDGVTDDLLTSSYISSASAINGVSLTIPSFPVSAVANGSILTLKGRVNTTSSVVVSGFGDSYIFCGLVYAGSITPPNPPAPIQSWVWTQQASPRVWYNIASSSDGVKLVSCDYGGFIYTSTDSGVTWVERPTSGKLGWIRVASSSDGVKLSSIGLVYANPTGSIYTSTDSGATWVERTTAGKRTWEGIASSSDGVKLIATVRNDYIYTSTDSGATWVEQTTSGKRNWGSGVASSSDGVKLVALNGGGFIYTSTDSGETWVERTTSGMRFWFSVASSSDGVKLVASVLDGFIYTSTDSGATWVERTTAGKREWYRLASSSDGVKLTASVFNGFIYTSTDSGATWIEQTSVGSRIWSGIASSSNGLKLVGCVEDGYIYTGVFS